MYYNDQYGYWHERLLLSRPLNEATVVATPDGDLYLEEFGDYEDWAVAGPRGGAPQGRHPVHRFGPLRPDQVQS